MAGTQPIYYRDKRGNEPVDEFIEALPAKRRMADFKRRMDARPRKPPRAAGKDAPPTRRRVT